MQQVRRLTARFSARHLHVRLVRAAPWLGLALVFVIPSCGGTELSSHWRQSDVAIDGAQDEWEGQTTFIEDANSILGIVNDDTHLYIMLATADRAMQMQIMRGLMLWFDADNDEKRRFGVRYPLITRDMLPERDSRKFDDDDRAAIFDQLEPQLDELEILGAQGSANRVPLGDAYGIEVKLSRANGALVYEVKVPLPSANNVYAIGATPGQSISIGLESPEYERPDGGRGGMEQGMGRGMGGRGGSGGRGGRSGSGGSRQSDMRPPEGFERPEPIEVWATLRLASPEISVAN